jgi:hypothetical protein
MNFLVCEMKNNMSYFWNYFCSALSDSMRPEQLQLRWEEFLSLTGYNQRFLIALMPTILAFSMYWTSALLFTTLDFTGWFSKYKVQPGKNHPPNTVKAFSAIKVVLFNQLVVGAPLAVLAFEVTKLVTGRDLPPRSDSDPCHHFPPLCCTFFPSL